MSVVINTNVESTKIQNCLTSATKNLSKTMERMSSGLKVKSAQDDAAGCVISARMKVQLNGTQIAQNNIQNAKSLLSTTEGNLDVVSDNLSRIRDLTLQAKNGTYSAEEIKAMDDEVQERIQEINRVSYSAKYSSSYLFGNGLVINKAKDETNGLGGKGATFQAGPNAGVDNTVLADKSLFASVEFSAMSGIGNFSLVKISAGEGDSIEYGKNSVQYNNGGTLESTPKVIKNDGSADAETSDFDKAILAMDRAIDNITDRKSIIGSAGNRLDSALSTLKTQFENLESANSLIIDADIASDASKYTQSSILQQVSTSLLAQANSAPSIAMSLV